MKREFDGREVRKSRNAEADLPIEPCSFQEKYTETRNEAIGFYPLDIYREWPRVEERSRGNELF